MASRAARTPAHPPAAAGASMIAGSSKRPGSSASSRKRAQGEEELFGQPDNARKASKKKDKPESSKSGSNVGSAFNPKPLHRVSREEDDLPDIPPPPPPSTRRPNRHREHAKQVASPAPRRTAAAFVGPPVGYEDEEDEHDNPTTRVQSLFTPRPLQAVAHLDFRPVKKPRPSALPPPSPGGPLMPPPSSVLSKRKRKSMMPGELLTDTVIPLNVADTPIINKNRSMRKGRESLGERGKRASGSFGRGEPSHPHSSVPSTQFYKHIPPEDSEPIRARWLIAWCAKRALDEHVGVGTSKGKQRAADPATKEIDALLGDVIDDFVANIAKGNVDTNVFSDVGAASSSLPVKPHERNVRNREISEKENAIIKRMKAEDRDWGRIASDANSQQTTVIAELQDKVRFSKPPDTVGDDEAVVWFRKALALAEEVANASDVDIGSAADFGQVEYEVDKLHHASHQANQYMQQSKRLLDGIFSSLAEDLRARDGGGELPSTDSDAPDTVALLARATAGSSGEPRGDPIHMLRALAAADAKHPSSESIARAATIPPAPRPSMAATPRRPSATPRRGGVYGRGTPGK